MSRGDAGIQEMTEEIEKNLANMDLDKYDEEDGKECVVFLPIE